MKANRSWKWMLGLGLATLICVNGMAQDGRGRHHKDRGGHDGNKGKQRYGRLARTDGKNLSDKVYRVTQADSAQKQKMKPAVDRASKRLESLRSSYQKQEKRILDSLKLQVKPFLKEEQLKKLSDWEEKTGRR